MRQTYLAATAALVCLFAATTTLGQDEADDSWPREISVPQGKVIIYQPQPDLLDGNQLDARAAVALEIIGSEEPVFGAIWFTARLETDRAERTATLVDISVTRTRFSEQDEAKAEQLTNLLEAEMPKWDIVIEPHEVHDIAVQPTRDVNRPGDRKRLDARHELITESAPRPPRRSPRSRTSPRPRARS